MTDFLTSPLGFGADDSPRTSYTLRVNGVERPVADAWIGESLLYVLRERLGLAGAKGGCEQGECGACSVQVDGQLTAACLVPAALAAGVEIRTVEGLAEEGVPSDVQEALAESGAVQCGYCAPGLAMAVHDLLERNHRPSELEARQALCGNLCRCTGYRGALAAVQAVATARADREESPEDGVAESPFFGDGPVDGLIEATSPMEELVPMAGAAVPAQAEHVDGYDYDQVEGADPAEDDGYDVEAELPVYVDVPPQHGGYENYETYEGYDTPGYGTQEPGYPPQESYPQQGYATGTYGQPYQQPYGEGPYPGGPFGGRFPSQSGGLASEAAAGEAVGTLLLTEPTGTRELPHVDPASAPHATGDFPAGGYATGQFEAGQFEAGGFEAGQFEADRFATGELPVVGEYAGEYAAEGYAAADSSGAEYGHRDHEFGGYATAGVPGQGGQADHDAQPAQVGHAGEPRLGPGLGAGLGAGMRAQAAARRLAGGGATGAQADAASPATGTAATAASRATAATPVSLGGAATGAAGLPSDVTGSFHVGTLSAPGAATGAAGPPFDVDGAAMRTDPPRDGATGVPGGLDPATGVYVLPHPHGQETGS